MILRDAVQKGLVAASKSMEGAMKRRIFNQGKATSGSIGSYRSRSYRKKRRRAGRQVGYKDLEFNGDLRRSIQTGQRGGESVLGFASKRRRLIAEYQEEQTGKEIFTPTEEEINDARQSFVQQYRRASRSRN